MNCLYYCPCFLCVAQMAHRLLVRRVWTLSVQDIRRLPSSSAAISTSSFSTSLQSPPSRVSLLSPSRTLPLTLHQISRRDVSFNVQDTEDFTERVVNSQLPVLVDFHAQWVLKDSCCWPPKLLAPRSGITKKENKWRLVFISVALFKMLASSGSKPTGSSLSWHVDVSQWAALNLLSGKAPTAIIQHTHFSFKSLLPQGYSGVFLPPYFCVFLSYVMWRFSPVECGQRNLNWFFFEIRLKY